MNNQPQLWYPKSTLPVIKRVFAQPDSATFNIRPIKHLVHRFVDGNGVNWLDPFAGWNSPAGITNDLNPDAPTKYHQHAIDFVRGLSGEFDGVLFDPPYSLRQMLEVYQSVGIDKLRPRDTTNFYGDLRNLIAPLIKTNGYALCFGWNSIGFGKKLGFEMLEIMMVCHGGAHNDTIVTVERKMQATMDLSEASIVSPSCESKSNNGAIQEPMAFQE